MPGAHVKITAPNPESGMAQVVVNGVDMSSYLQCEPFIVDLGDAPKGIRPSVTVAIACDLLEVDLPEAFVHALAVTVDEEVGA